MPSKPRRNPDGTPKTTKGRAKGEPNNAVERCALCNGDYLSRDGHICKRSMKPLLRLDRSPHDDS
jgi:hypothetical protein